MEKSKMFPQNIISIIAYSIIVLLILTFPAYGSTYYIYLTTSFFILALAASSVNLLLGFSGILTFGHAGFFAIGGYTSALILKLVIENFFISLFAAILLTAVIAFIFGLVCIRVAEEAAVIFFAMLTLAFGQIVYTVAYKWSSLTGGDNGLTGIPTPNIDFILFNVNTFDRTQLYYFSFAIVFVLLFLIYRLIKSPFGLILQAIRDNKERTRFMGQNVRMYQLTVFVISAIICGIAGSLMQLYEAFASPELAHWTKSAEFVIASILGGIYNFVGPIIGAFVIIFMEDFLSEYTIYWEFFLGIIVIFIVLIMPEGISGSIQKFIHKYKTTK